MKRRRFISGALAFLICCTTIANAGTTAAAAETAVPEIKTETSSSESASQEEAIVLYKESSTLPQLEEIQAQLNEDEIAVAEELVLNYGADFDPASDFTKIAYNDDKVKISFKEAVNEKLEAFNTEVPGKYQAVYEVVPLRDSNMAYQIVRYITVNDKEPETAGHGENNGGEDKNTEETDDDSDSDPAQQNEISEESESTEPETSADSPDEENASLEGRSRLYCQRAGRRPLRQGSTHPARALPAASLRQVRARLPRCEEGSPVEGRYALPGAPIAAYISAPLLCGTWNPAQCQHSARFYQRSRNRFLRYRRSACTGFPVFLQGINSRKLYRASSLGKPLPRIPAVQA